MKGLNPHDLNVWPNIAVFDIEAKNWVEVYIVGHVDEYGNKKAFKDIPSYMNWLFTKFPGQHVWAHYGGKYDVRFILAESCRRHGSWKTFESGGSLVISSVWDPLTNRTIKFCDSSRLLVGSVAKLGKMIGLEKLDVDRTKMGENDLKTEIEYCIRDCEVVLKALQMLRDVTTNVGCDFAYTLASMMCRFVRRSPVLDFIKFQDKKDLSNEDEQFLLADQFCSPAYFGGRVEVFKRGLYKRKLYYYDIRSSYPASMLKPLPAYFRDFHPAPKRKGRKSLERYLSYPGITEAEIEIEPGTQYIPVLPVIYRNRLVFPEGRFRGRWTNIELMKAYEMGAQITPIVQARFTERPFLRKFVEVFFELRQKAIDKGDDAGAYTYKIALNSLYGKLAETVDRRHTIFGDKAYKRAIQMYGHEHVFPNGHVPGVYDVVVQERGPFRHVAAGSYVTAYSRLLLLEYLQWAISLGGNIYYSDTDSLVTDILLPETPDELGNLKLEETFVEGEFLAPKVYRGVLENGKSVYKVKGMPVSGLSDEESYHRWLVYKNEVYPQTIDKNVWNQHKWTQEYLASKDGISGFRTDLNHGRIDPQPQKLIRYMRNEDIKRTHIKSNSSPLIMESIA
jgi:hypothetical protein